MAAGTLQTIAICAEGTGTLLLAGRAISCGVDAAGNPMTLQMMQAYVIAPGSASYIDAVGAPFDYGQASALWAAAFMPVIMFFFFSKGVGGVLDLIRGA